MPKVDILLSSRGKRTQLEIANEIGISRSYYALIENGWTPSLRVALLVANYYHIPVEAIWGNSSVSRPA